MEPLFSRYILMCFPTLPVLKPCLSTRHSIFSSLNVTGIRSGVRKRDTGYGIRWQIWNVPLEWYAVLETVLVSLDKTTLSSYPITYDMWLFIFGGKLKRSNTRTSTTFFINRTYRGLRPPPLRISKLCVVELSGKNSGSFPTSSRDWFGALLFDSVMGGLLPDFSEDK